MWQKGGSSGLMTFTDAKQYAHRINSEKFAGFNDWRLPTVEEAMSLMEPQAYDGPHINPKFQRGINSYGRQIALLIIEYGCSISTMEYSVQRRIASTHGFG